MRRFLLAITLVIATAGCSGAEESPSAAPATSPQHTSPAPFPSGPSTAPPTVAGDDNSICAYPNLRTFLNEIEKYASRAGLEPDAPLRDWESALEEVRYIAMGAVGPPLGDAAVGVDGYLDAVEGSHLDARFRSPEARNYAHVTAKAAARIAKTCGIDVDITIPDKPKLSLLGLSRPEAAAQDG